MQYTRLKFTTPIKQHSDSCTFYRQRATLGRTPTSRSARSVTDRGNPPTNTSAPFTRRSAHTHPPTPQDSFTTQRKTRSRYQREETHPITLLVVVAMRRRPPLLLKSPTSNKKKKKEAQEGQDAISPTKSAPNRTRRRPAGSPAPNPPSPGRIESKKQGGFRGLSLEHAPFTESTAVCAEPFQNFFSSTNYPF